MKAESEVKEKPQLRLFVMDESSGDPEEWISSSPSLVIAESAEDAVRRWPYLANTAVEVVFVRPTVLHVQPDPIDNL